MENAYCEKHHFGRLGMSECIWCKAERLEKALEAIRDAPGGGPGRRIAALALEKEE
jgi:hypothetical protein